MKFNVEPKKNPYRCITPGEYVLKIVGIKEVILTNDDSAAEGQRAVRITLEGVDGEAKGVLFQIQFLENEPEYVGYFALAVYPEKEGEENFEFEINDDLLGKHILGHVKNIEKNGRHMNRVHRFERVK